MLSFVILSVVIMKVIPKKHLGQHFLSSESIANRIAELIEENTQEKVIEIGPGMGILTQFLHKRCAEKLICIEIDTESVQYLRNSELNGSIEIVEGDFLQMGKEMLQDYKQASIIGNFPYNISTQIAFVAIENHEYVKQFCGMFQKEVALRFCAAPHSKEYGITSVLLQAYFQCNYCFTVNEGAFHPPPKVKSGVINCRIKQDLPTCKYSTLHTLVKLAFNQRRKTFANATKSLTSAYQISWPEEIGKLRAENISVEKYIELALMLENSKQ